MVAFIQAPFSTKRVKTRSPTPTKRHRIVARDKPEYDTILIGTGLSTLSTAALLHTYDATHRSLILEAHTTPGGTAHTFTRRCESGKLIFESGPHLFSGLQAGDDNPVGQLFAAIGVQPELIDYHTWGVILGHQCVITEVPGDPLLGELLSAQGRAEIRALTEALRPLGEAAKALPVACARADIDMARLIVPRLPRLVKHIPHVGELARPFDTVLRRHVKDRLAYALVNLLCFLLAGVGAERVPTAEVAFMFAEWTGGAGLQRPVGGAGGVVDSLLAYIRERGARVRTGCKVENVVVEDGRAVGVRMQSGEVVSASRVVSGVSCHDLDLLLGRGHRQEICDSFLHLHVGVRLDVLNVKELQANYVVVEDIFCDIEKPGNVVLVSLPSVIDDTVAPEGWAVLHAYTPATEPWAEWERLTEGSAEYEQYKEERAAVLWKAVNKIFGCDLRANAEIALVGTPKTHRKYLRRARGSYGAKVDARKGLAMGISGGWDTGVDRLLAVGDGVFPGVGVPAVVGSAWIAANSCVDVARQEELLKRIGL